MKFFRIMIMFVIPAILAVACSSLDEIHKRIQLILPSYLESGVFVSVTSGNDANSGTNRNSPLKTIQVALSNAVVFGLTNIYVEKGVYTPGNGLNSTGNGVVISNSYLRIVGGFGSDFQTQRLDYSVLNGTNALALVFRIINATNVYMEGFVFCNGIGGGQILSPSNTLVDIAISNNNTQRGLYISGNNNRIDRAVFCFNSSTGFGGALDVVGNQNSINGLFYTNGYSVTTWGGAACLEGSSNTLTGTFSNNYSLYYGGAIVIRNGSFNTVVNSLIVSNYARWHSGGVLVYLSTYSVISNSVVSGNTVNHITNMASGIFIQDGASNTVIDCQLYGNRSLNNTAPGGGCIFFNGSDNSRILNCVITNNSSGDKDALITMDGSSAIVNLVLSNNMLGGTNGSSAIGIREYNGNTTGHVILNNRFVSNAIGFLYWNNGDSPIVTNNSSWTNINNTSYSGASLASNNSLQ